MGFSNSHLAERFARGKTKGKGNSMFIEGNVIYSYGYHFPISIKLGPGKYLFNTDRYSVSTSRHQLHTRQAIDRFDYESEIIECTTEEIKDAIRWPDGPIVLTKKVKPTSVEECVDMIKEIYSKRGLTHFPKQKVLNLINNWEMLKCL